MCQAFIVISRLEERERGGVVVERRTSNREVLGSIPTSGTVLTRTLSFNTNKQPFGS